MARCIMKWNYQNLRMLLYRPTLLILANNGAEQATKENDILAVDRCRELALRNIEDISNDWERHQMSGWNGVWMMYQATMIPLLSILWQPHSPSVPEWHRQVEVTLGVLDVMEEWSLSAARSREVIRRIHDATRLLSKTGGDDSHRDAIQNGLYDEGISMAPVQLDMDETLNMIEQGWMADLNGMIWDHQAPTLALAEPEHHQGFEQEYRPMGYAEMGIGQMYHNQ